MTKSDQAFCARWAFLTHENGSAVGINDQGSFEQHR